DTVLEEMARGDFPFKRSLEDIHMNVESRLAELIGDPAGRLHTARARNDQVATDLKLGTRDANDPLGGRRAEPQAVLIDRAEEFGDPAGRLHTARSRNGQVAPGRRLWTRDAIDSLDAGLAELQAVLIDRAEEFADTTMPGFTHVQIAQPVTMGHHLLAYVEML